MGSHSCELPFSRDFNKLSLGHEQPDSEAREAAAILAFIKQQHKRHQSMVTGVDAMPEHKEHSPIGSAELQGFQALRQYFNAAEEAEFLDAFFDSESSKIHGPAFHEDCEVIRREFQGPQTALLWVRPEYINIREYLKRHGRAPVVVTGQPGIGK